MRELIVRRFFSEISTLMGLTRTIVVLFFFFICVLYHKSTSLSSRVSVNMDKFCVSGNHCSTSTRTLKKSFSDFSIVRERIFPCPEKSSPIWRKGPPSKSTYAMSVLLSAIPARQKSDLPSMVYQP